MGKYADMELEREIFGGDYPKGAFTRYVKRTWKGPHKCNQCSRGFKTPEALTAHRDAKGHK